jgi:hypothetical protein
LAQIEDVNDSSSIADALRLQMMATWMAKCGIKSRIVDKRGTKIFNGQADGEFTPTPRFELLLKDDM